MGKVEQTLLSPLPALGKGSIIFLSRSEMSIHDNGIRVRTQGALASGRQECWSWSWERPHEHPTGLATSWGLSIIIRIPMFTKALEEMIHTVRGAQEG